MHTDFLKFVAAKFNLNLAFILLFISIVLIKIRIYTVYIVLKQDLHSIWVNLWTYLQMN